jgi:hypothetical protein
VVGKEAVIMLKFSVSQEVLNLGVRVAGLFVTDLNNNPVNPGVESLRSEIWKHRRIF